MISWKSLGILFVKTSSIKLSSSSFFSEEPDIILTEGFEFDLRVFFSAGEISLLSIFFIISSGVGRSDI